MGVRQRSSSQEDRQHFRRHHAVHIMGESGRQLLPPRAYSGAVVTGVRLVRMLLVQSALEARRVIASAGATDR